MHQQQAAAASPSLSWSLYSLDIQPDGWLNLWTLSSVVIAICGWWCLCVCACVNWMHRHENCWDNLNQCRLPPHFVQWHRIHSHYASGWCRRCRPITISAGAIISYVARIILTSSPPPTTTIAPVRQVRHERTHIACSSSHGCRLARRHSTLF